MDIMEGGDVEKTVGYNSLGHALEAATLGVPHGSDSAALGRDEDTALVMKKVINAYGGNPDLMNDQYGMSDSIGRMTAGYIDDLNYSATNFAGSGDAYNREELFGSGRNDFGDLQTKKFLLTVGRNEESYEIASSVQQVYTASGISGHADQSDAMAFAKRSMWFHGALDEARTEQIGKDFAEEADKKNMALEQQAEWRKFAVGAAVAGGVAVATGPVAVAAYPIVVPLAEQAGEAVKTGSSNEIAEWLKENEYDNSRQAVATQQDVIHAGQVAAATPILNYLDSSDVSEEDRRNFIDTLQGVYNDGRMATNTDNAPGQ
ncbi:hypothetical protein [Streptomyces thermolineatus]|uniref:hypothetical protein n=1 Tax=Streptomyces thermolineatus TaxID=44033 RepID=UPI00384E2E3E